GGKLRENTLVQNHGVAGTLWTDQVGLKDGRGQCFRLPKITAADTLVLGGSRTNVALFFEQSPNQKLCLSRDISRQVISPQQPAKLILQRRGRGYAFRRTLGQSHR